MKVRLTLEDERLAAYCALKRVIKAAVDDKQDSRYNKSGNYHQMVSEHAEAVGAEIAIHKHFNLDQFKVMTTQFKTDADVTLPNGQGIEVRWTHWIDGQLIIYEYDRSDDVAVLVVGRSPILTIAGWLSVKDCRQDKYRQQHQPTWWIPQRNLNPIETLLESNYGDSSIPLSVL